MPDTNPNQTSPPPELAQAALAELEDPLSPLAREAAPRGGANVHGSFSIETFCNQGSLSLTHEDAAGWRNYLNQFHASNFWYADSGVKPWAYYEDYDNWQDTYGMDAVMAAYHSGHGGMDANGVFHVPMGANWGSLGCTALSSNMRLGNEHLRYIFWSTCESLRVLDGHSPIRTWQEANLGWRMMFGFETVSWDNADYGRFFWDEWNKGKSLSTAWLDASWRIAHDQSPSAVACGATQAEAQDRLYNERFLEAGQASRNWWWWRWYSAARVSRTPQRNLPHELQLAVLRPASTQALEPTDLSDRFGFTSKDLKPRADGSFAARSGERYLARGAKGAIDVRVAPPNQDNRTPLALNKARSLADDAIRQFGLDNGNSLVFDRAFHSSAAGGSTEGSGKMEAVHHVETIFQFRQTIGGVPVVCPGGGIVRVGIDNDGNLTDLHSSVREIDSLSSKARITPPQPQENGHAGAAYTNGLFAEDDVDSLLAPAVSQRLRGLMARGGSIVGVSAVPGTTEVGYKLNHDTAELVARKGIEVDFGGGYRKRYWVETTVFG